MFPSPFLPRGVDGKVNYEASLDDCATIFQYCTILNKLLVIKDIKEQAMKIYYLSGHVIDIKQIQPILKKQSSPSSLYTLQ